MRTERIESISEYCDQWCERCAFTSRCSAYAVQAAVGMCGDLQEAIQLALGAPMMPGKSGDGRQSTLVKIVQPTPEQRRELEIALNVGAKRIKEHPLTRHAMHLAIEMHQWFHAHAAALASPDDLVRESVAIARWDATLIGAKLTRAVQGCDGDGYNHECSDDPVQQDWNGSAKVALLLMERSESAWQTIAQATGDVTAAEFGVQLAALRNEAERLFPFARLFHRPGFDDTDQN
jgi:hypothetical protein